MQIELIAVGKRMPAWIDTAVKEYSKRLTDPVQFKLIEITAAIRSKNSHSERYKQKEQHGIEAALSSDSVIIALDEKGKPVSSQMLAKQLQTWVDENRQISLIIGGADGLSDDLKDKAEQIWSLSAMTLPHALVRVMVVEQIYRAWSMIKNHPYHRE